tara:strand:+ start:9856 stop:10356 length:501 start_codon:yes stop_codon:yes gene_type:complete
VVPFVVVELILLVSRFDQKHELTDDVRSGLAILLIAGLFSFGDRPQKKPTPAPWWRWVGSVGRRPGWFGGGSDPGSCQFLLCFALPQSCGEVGTGELPADTGGGQLLNVSVHCFDTRHPDAADEHALKRCVALAVSMKLADVFSAAWILSGRLRKWHDVFGVQVDH